MQCKNIYFSLKYKKKTDIFFHFNYPYECWSIYR